MKTNKTPEEIRAIGKKLLDELKEKGPNLDKVGKTVVRLGASKSNNIKEEEDESISKARQFRKLKNDVSKERKELEDLIKNNPKDVSNETNCS
jgi:hypothetical protein